MEGLILCGGESRRMGEPKHLVDYQGRSLLNHAINLLEKLGLKYYLSINSNQIELAKAYTCIPDEFENAGPLGGILSALSATKSDLLVIPIDMPHLSAELVGTLLKSKTLSCFSIYDKIEPFPSFWPNNKFEKLRTSINNNDLSVRYFLKEQQAQLIETTDQDSFKNINSILDL